jgi:hypothetical protein
MLYFLLVLGLVPGTSLQLTFSEVLIVAYLLGMALVWRLGLFTTNYHQSKELAALKKRAGRKLGLNDLKAVQLIGRTVVTPPERIARQPLYVRELQSRQYERNIQPERYLLRPRAVYYA